MLVALQNPIGLSNDYSFTFHFLYLDSLGDILNKESYYCDKNNGITPNSEGGVLLDFYIQILTSTQVKIYTYHYYKSNQNAIYIFDTVSSVMTAKYLFYPYVQVGSVLTALFVSETYSFIVGSEKSYTKIGGSSNKAFTYNIGFIIPHYEPTTSCIYFSTSFATSGFKGWSLPLYDLTQDIPIYTASTPYTAQISPELILDTIVPNAIIKTGWCDNNPV